MAIVVAPTGETRVNSTLADSQQRPSISILQDGGWIVTWMSEAQDGSGSGIYQQRYDAAGQAIGTEIQVNRQWSGDQMYSAVTALPNGGWVVAWTSTDQDGSGRGIYHQRYNAYGQKVGPERLVNATTDGNQIFPELTALSDGGWVITWRGDSTNSWDIYQQRYDAHGFESGGEVRVNTSVLDEQFDPAVAALADGGWIVTWSSFNRDGSGYEVRQQRYSAAGTSVGGEVLVNTQNAGQQSTASVVALADGGWIVTWESGNGVDYDIYQQRYDADGWTVDEERLVNAGTTGVQGSPVVTALPDGGWLVVWVSSDEGGSGPGIYQRRFGADGRATDNADALVNATPSDLRAFHSVQVLQDGGWIMTWQEKSDASASAPYDIYQQRFTASGVKVGPTTPTGLDLAVKAVAEGASTTILAGTLSTDAFVSDHAFTYRLVDDAGGRFRLEGNQIKVKDGVKLDYEQARSHVVKVEVKDAAGATLTKSFTIAVADVGSEKLTGSADSDALKGGASKDTFNGGTGHDILWGGLGNDVLTGGSGRDVFVFDTRPNTSTNKDRIVDFNVRDDGIRLDNAVFTKLGSGSAASPVQLKGSYFVKGSAAKDANDYVIYDAAKGVLLYDADGSGRGRAVEIATLAKNLAMTSKDFFVI